MTAQTPGCGSNTDARKRQREAEAARAETPETTGLREAVLTELGVCPFKENVNDASMCLCGLPALGHDSAAERIVLNDHPTIATLLATHPTPEASPDPAEVTPEDVRPHHWINQNGRCDNGQMLDAGDDWQPVYRGHDIASLIEQARAEGKAWERTARQAYAQHEHEWKRAEKAEAERDRLAAAVERVEALVDAWGGDWAGRDAAQPFIRALRAALSDAGRGAQ